MALPPVHVLIPVALLLMSSWSAWMLTVASRRTITHLPGFDGPLPIQFETGYVTVGESEEVNLFYYFMKSERNPAEDPVMVWLTGGPGCSALSGMAFEIGPLTFDVMASIGGGLPTLVYRPESWTKVCNIIFLDSPVGTGFSYSKTVKGYQSGDFKSSRDVHTFIRKWYVEHPEFTSNPLYIGGDSYSGITVPIVVQEVSNGNRMLPI
uniref:Serine carboxypeptidase-like 18 n=1 Tax=Anthurium amnicola TaxID=1678845 RepID=A0A1D1XKW4_9ARAE